MAALAAARAGASALGLLWQPAMATLAAGGVTPAALVGWHQLARPDLSDVLQAYFPDLPLALLAAGVVGFAIVNATLEEVIWRGLLQERLEELGGSGLAVGATALSFGIQHAHGFPRGLAGVVMVAAWGALLALLRRRSGGLLAPILAHIVADAAIGGILLTLL